MGKKKKKRSRAVCVCYYCSLETKDEASLIEHQRAKHFRCPDCHKKFDSVSSMAAHYSGVHRKTIDKAPNATPGADSVDVPVYGMDGVPPEWLAEYLGEEVDANTATKARKIGDEQAQVFAHGAYPPAMGVPTHPPMASPPSGYPAAQFPPRASYPMIPPGGVGIGGGPMYPPHFAGAPYMPTAGSMPHHMQHAPRFPPQYFPPQRFPPGFSMLPASHGGMVAPTGTSAVFPSAPMHHPPHMSAPTQQPLGFSAAGYQQQQLPPHLAGSHSSPVVPPPMPLSTVTEAPPPELGLSLVFAEERSMEELRAEWFLKR
jgi:hypothetical protein